MDYESFVEWFELLQDYDLKLIPTVDAIAPLNPGGFPVYFGSGISKQLAEGKNLGEALMFPVDNAYTAFQYIDNAQNKVEKIRRIGEVAFEMGSLTSLSMTSNVSSGATGVVSTEVSRDRKFKIMYDKYCMKIRSRRWFEDRTPMSFSEFKEQYNFQKSSVGKFNPYKPMEVPTVRGIRPNVRVAVSTGDLVVFSQTSGGHMCSPVSPNISVPRPRFKFPSFRNGGAFIISPNLRISRWQFPFIAIEPQSATFVNNDVSFEGESFLMFACIFMCLFKEAYLIIKCNKEMVLNNHLAYELYDYFELYF